MEKVVISVGGSVLVPDEDPKYISELSEMLAELSEKVELIVVCGGGKPSRYYAKLGRAVGGTTEQLDSLCIEVTRVNAGLLSIALGEHAAKEIPKKAEDAVKLRKSSGKIVVMGGTEPGHTTDAVAAMIAKEWKADRIVNASNVDAVYSDDPRKNPKAERYEKITIDRLKEIVGDEHEAARSYVFDPMGIDIAKSAKTDLFMVNGRKLSELRNAILGKKIEGTFVDSH